MLKSPKIKPAGLSTPAIPGTQGGITIQPMVAPAPQAGDKLVRGGQSAGRPGQIVSAANRWRENYNPLRHFTMRRVVELLELGQRGDYAYLQWAYRFIERRNATLSGLISRCEAPFATFDWQIKTKSICPPGMTPNAFKALAANQKAALEDAYSRIDNLVGAIKHLHLADFRGYAHLQKWRDDQGVYHLEPLNQWCVCRDGLEGNWWWNPDSRSTSAPLQFLGPDFCIGGDALPIADFIIRECPRPIDEIGIVDTVRRGMCEKDWDAFIEIYGIPGGVVTMPANVPPGKEAEYEAAAKAVAEGASGAIPNGSEYKPNDGPRGVDPFSPRLAWLNEQLVLAGTGGKLAMLTEKTAGSRGNSSVHDGAFNDISNARAHSCSEEFQRQFDAEILGAQFPGQPGLAYFYFGAEEEEDVAGLVANVVALKTAGKDTDTEWLSEKTGMPLTDCAVPAALQPGGDEDEENPAPDKGGKAGDDDDNLDNLKNRERFAYQLGRNFRALLQQRS